MVSSSLELSEDEEEEDLYHVDILKSEGKCSVRLSYCVSQVVVAMESGRRVARAYRGENEERREIDVEGNAPYSSAVAFRKLLLIWSVEGRLRERIVGRMRT